MQRGVTPQTVYLHQGVFHLLYDPDPHGKIGLATSENGVLWRKYPGNPVFIPGGPGAWDSSMAGATVVLDGDSLRLWYSAYGPAVSEWESAWQIGYAVSPIDPTVLSVGQEQEIPDDVSR